MPVARRHFKLGAYCIYLIVSCSLWSFSFRHFVLLTFKGILQSKTAYIVFSTLSAGLDDAKPFFG